MWQWFVAYTDWHFLGTGSGTGPFLGSVDDETRTYIREEWERCLKLYRKYIERAHWIADHLDEPDWKDLEENVHKLSGKLATAFDNVGQALGGEGAITLWERLELCAKGQVEA